MESGSHRAVIMALSANLCIAVAKFAGYFATGAASMLAEAVHSVADTGNQALLLWGGASSRRRASSWHPFGYGRERYFWACVVALVMFSLGGLFALYEGIQKFVHPHALTRPLWAVGVLVFALFLEGAAFRSASSTARKQKGSAGWWEFIRHTKNPELPVVLLEDLAALCGLVIALLGAGLAIATGDTRFDAAGSIAIGLLLVAIAAILASEMKSLLIGEAASPRDLERIRSVIVGSPSVQRLIHMRTQHLGPDELLVGAKLEFDSRLNFRELSDAIDVVEARIRQRIPIARIIYLEPDVYDPEEVST